jgi:hypothetical protein
MKFCAMPVMSTEAPLPAVLSHSRYRSMRWRNGLGSTLEIARSPAGEGAFDWRLSLASLNASGPFSDYVGYHRAVSLVDGAGFRLEIGGEAALLLDTPGATALFDGAAPANCSLLDGPCHDLSLMVRDPGRILQVETIALDHPQTLAAEASALQALFCLRGIAEATVAGDSHRLQAQDTLLLPAAAPALFLRPASLEPALLLRLEWSC